MTPTPDLRELLNAPAPLVVASFADGVPDRDLTEAKVDGLDVAEIRIDKFVETDRVHVMAEVQRFGAFPTIGTIRAQSEGGDWRGSEADRLDLFEAVMPFVQAVDIELSSRGALPVVIDMAKGGAEEKVVVVSNHNFDETPSMAELEEMVSKAKSLGADLFKLAVRARDTDELRRLADFTIKNASLGVVTIAIGPFGPISRLLFPVLGSRLTYAKGTLPPVSGQLDYKTTFELLRVFYPEYNDKKIVELRILESA